MSKRKTSAGDAISRIEKQIEAGMTSGVHVGTRTVFLTGEVDESMATRFLMVFRVLDSTPGAIRVVLASEGGHIDYGFAIYDTIKLSNNPVCVDVTGLAQSMATIILQAGDMRRATPQTRFMTHQAWVRVGDAGLSAADLLNEGRELAFNNERIYRILSERSEGKLTVEDAITLCKKDTYFPAEEALKRGLIDVVLLPMKRVTLVEPTPPKLLSGTKSHSKKGKGRK